MRILIAIILIVPGVLCVNYPLETTDDLYEMESVWQYLKTYSIWQERVPKSAFEYGSPELMLYHMYDTLKGAEKQYTLYDDITCGACGLSTAGAGAAHNYRTVAWDSLTDSTAQVTIYKFESDTYDSLLSAILAMNEHRFFRNIIIDLRNNGGGDIEATDSIIEAILPANTPYLIETYRKYDSQNRQAVTIDSEIQITKGPQHWLFANRRYAVLTDSFSASASEMLVAAMKDGFPRGKGDTVVIVGETTYGKGIGQICIKRTYLRRRSIKITFMKMEGVTNRTGKYHRKGISPDVVIHDRKQQEDVALKILEPSARLKKEFVLPTSFDDKNQFSPERIINAFFDGQAGESAKILKKK